MYPVPTTYLYRVHSLTTRQQQTLSNQHDQCFYECHNSYIHDEWCTFNIIPQDFTLSTHKIYRHKHTKDFNIKM